MPADRCPADVPRHFRDHERVDARVPRRRPRAGAASTTTISKTLQGIAVGGLNSAHRVIATLEALGDEFIERFDGFDYGYRMGCNVCDNATAVSAHEYCLKVTGEPYVDCANCGSEIHIGPAVAQIRDPDDRALDDDQLRSFAWYHSSTWAEWPSSVYAEHRSGELSSSWFAAQHIDLDRVVHTQTHQALHLGTYESAIENMLRRMRNQGDGQSQFYLFRVGLAIRTGDVEPGYRDENADEAAQLTTDDLIDHSVVRYLNAREACGTISLAVRPDVIDAIQGVAIPIDFGGLDLTEIQPELDRIEAQRVSSLADALSPEVIRILDDPVTGPAQQRAVTWARSTAASAVYPAWRDASDLLARHLLTDVSLAIVDDFVSALRQRTTSKTDVNDYARLFSAMSALLSRGTDVTAIVASGASRKPPPSEPTDTLPARGTRGREPHTERW